MKTYFADFGQARPPNRVRSADNHTGHIENFGQQGREFRPEDLNVFKLPYYAA